MREREGERVGVFGGGGGGIKSKSIHVGGPSLTFNFGRGVLLSLGRDDGSHLLLTGQ